jgi:hypothetical protein
LMAVASNDHRYWGFWCLASNNCRCAGFNLPYKKYIFNTSSNQVMSWICEWINGRRRLLINWKILTECKQYTVVIAPP